MRRFAALLLFLTACPPKPEPPPPPPPPPPPAPRDAGAAPVTRGPPWTLDRSAFTPPNIPDALTFFGWSSDGLRYGLQIDIPAEGADCSDAYRVHVVDAATDRFVDGGEIEVKRDQPEGGESGCVPPDLRAVAEARRAPVLSANGVVTGHFLPPTKPTKTTDGWRVTWSNGATSKIEFEVRHAVQDPYGPEADKGAAYRLVVDGTTIEPGTRRRPGVIRYALDEARVFESPDGRHAAIVIERYERAFEGARRSWMSNGFTRTTGTAP